MGLKHEKRNILVDSPDYESVHHREEFYVEVGFRHATYKNYHLLKALKRKLPVFLKVEKSRNSDVKIKNLAPAKQK